MPNDTTYIIVTGANSGLGYSICCRLIDEFLPTRDNSSKLHLIPTTRSQSKASITVSRLQAHLAKYCRNAEKVTPGITKILQSRITIKPELLDLCNIISIQKASRRLRQKYERIDVVINNAGIGGWVGIDWLRAVKQFFTEGIQFVTTPNFKIGSVGSATAAQIQRILDKEDGNGTDQIGDARAEPQLGEVFCANVFGHYLLVHYIMSSLVRPAGQEASRVVWTSTLEAYGRTFSMDDFQGMETSTSYESSKRLTDVLALTANAPSSKPYTDKYFTPEASASDNLASSAIIEEELTPRKASLRASTRRAGSSTPTGSLTPRMRSPFPASSSSAAKTPPSMYTSHPGMCVTEIVSIPTILVYAWIAMFYVARWCGSPWHNTWSYSGATCTTYLALAPKEQLDDFAGGDSADIKWGSATNWRGEERVKRTEVEWLYDDKGQSEPEEKKEDFLALGGQVWKRMEELRGEWEQRLRDAGEGVV